MDGGSLRLGNQGNEAGQGMDEVDQTRSSPEPSDLAGGEGRLLAPPELADNANARLKISKWTDEKHNLYLNSIEASFVKKMQSDEYSLKDMRRRWFWSTQNVLRNCSNSSNVDSQQLPSGQFKVLRRGCWEKVSFRKSHAHFGIKDDPSLLSSPWIGHFRSSSSNKGLLDSNSSNPPETDDLSCEASHLNRRKYGASDCGMVTTSEVSDQNFVDEEGSNRGHSRSTGKKKKLIVSGSDPSIKDQVVPFEDSPLGAGCDGGGASEGKEDGGRRRQRSFDEYAHLAASIVFQRNSGRDQSSCSEEREESESITSG